MSIRGRKKPEQQVTSLSIGDTRRVLWTASNLALCNLAAQNTSATVTEQQLELKRYYTSFYLGSLFSFVDKVAAKDETDSDDLPQGEGTRIDRADLMAEITTKLDEIYQGFNLGSEDTYGRSHIKDPEFVAMDLLSSLIDTAYFRATSPRIAKERIISFAPKGIDEI
jgi:hypothetical protein